MGIQDFPNRRDGEAFEVVKRLLNGYGSRLVRKLVEESLVRCLADWHSKKKIPETLEKN